MTEVKYREQDGYYLLQAQGHAGAGKKGQDIVCAGISVLAQTAAQRVCDLYSAGKLAAFPVIEIADGSLLVSATAREDEPAVKECFHTVLTGMEMLAQQYQQYVTFVK